MPFVNTLFEIFIFCPFQLWFPNKIVDFFEVKNSWKCWGFVKIELLDKNLNFRIVWIILLLLFTCFDGKCNDKQQDQKKQNIDDGKTDDKASPAFGVFFVILIFL